MLSTTDHLIISLKHFLYRRQLLFHHKVTPIFLYFPKLHVITANCFMLLFVDSIYNWYWFHLIFFQLVSIFNKLYLVIIILLDILINVYKSSKIHENRKHLQSLQDNMMFYWWSNHRKYTSSSCVVLRKINNHYAKVRLDQTRVIIYLWYIE